MSDPQDSRVQTAADEDEGSDPFADFDAFSGIGTVRDPYEKFGDRSRSPVQKMDSEIGSFLGDGDQFAVLSHESVSRVLRDGQCFSSTIYEGSMGLVMGHTILEMDEPEHGRHRGLIQKAFTRKALDSWEKDLVRPVVQRRIDAFRQRGHAELLRELTFPFPVDVITGMLGIPKELQREFHRRAIELISITVDPGRGVAASQRLEEMFLPLIAARRESPGEDLISLLAAAELDGERLNDDQINAFLRLLLPAGAETTYRSSSNLLYGLLTRPEQLEALRQDRSLMPQAMEEGLRWEPPLLVILRKVMRDTVLEGTPVPEGSTLYVNLGAANRDPKRYDEPDRFDLFRKPRQHVAFGFGAHRCLGMHLARVETFVVLEALLDQLPNLRLDGDPEQVFISGEMFRAPNALPVRFDPA